MYLYDSFVPYYNICKPQVQTKTYYKAFCVVIFFLQVKNVIVEKIKKHFFLYRPMLFYQDCMAKNKRVNRPDSPRVCGSTFINRSRTKPRSMTMSMRAKIYDKYNVSHKTTTTVKHIGDTDPWNSNQTPNK